MIPDFLANAASHAHEKPAEESCGLVIRTSKKEMLFLPCENKAEERGTSFEIFLPDIRAAKEKGKLVASFHSHLKSCRPSSTDIYASEAVNLPMFIYSLRDHNFCCHRPILHKKRPLLGREHIWGVQDCLSLVCDWYLQSGIDVPGPFLFSSDLRQVDIIKETLRAGMVPVPLWEERRVGDLLLIRPPDYPEPHYAVLCEERKILHQVRGYLSRRSRLEGYWGERVRQVFRLPDAKLSKLLPPMLEIR